ncbi:Dymeclin [Galemys pyrenaicus]|uniref:Dymeclin n=1 Tax=Galemys pyrenaicus TaxID=202257 RepID=A0A8J6DE70_GALPY|nr:Dymeclin [Galemys pyrenaicus]
MHVRRHPHTGYIIPEVGDPLMFTVTKLPNGVFLRILFSLLSKKHNKVLEQATQSLRGSLSSNDVPLPDYAQDLNVIEEVIRMMLEIINSCLTNSLHHNPNLVYALLYKRDLFEQFRTHPSFQDIMQNIDLVITFFSSRLLQAGAELSVERVLEIIKQGVVALPKDRLKDPRLRVLTVYAHSGYSRLPFRLLVNNLNAMIVGQNLPSVKLLADVQWTVFLHVSALLHAVLAFFLPSFLLLTASSLVCQATAASPEMGGLGGALSHFLQRGAECGGGITCTVAAVPAVKIIKCVAVGSQATGHWYQVGEVIGTAATESYACPAAPSNWLVVFSAKKDDTMSTRGRHHRVPASVMATSVIPSCQPPKLTPGLPHYLLDSRKHGASTSPHVRWHNAPLGLATWPGQNTVRRDIKSVARTPIEAGPEPSQRECWLGGRDSDTYWVGMSEGEPRGIPAVSKFPELKFKYVEEEQPEEFFIPYVWSLVYNSAVGLYWNPQDIQLFAMDSD